MTVKSGKGSAAMPRSHLPLVTAHILYYRNGQDLYETIDSVLMQDYPNIELIVSDDASPEGFHPTAVECYIRRHMGNNIKNIRVNQNKENLGTVRHLELLREMSSGEIEISIAADDVWKDEKVFSDFVSVFEQYGEECVCVMSQVEMCDETLKKTEELFVKADIVDLLKRRDYKELYNREILECELPGLGSAYRSSLWKKLPRLSDTCSLIEDYTTHLLMLAAGLPFHWLDRTTAKHRAGGVSHGNSKNNASVYARFIRDNLALYEQLILPYPERAGKADFMKASMKYEKMCEYYEALPKGEPVPSRPDCDAEPLVTVVLVSYEHQDYIIEALESVERQTYPNIQLIVTDDHSTDRTVPLAEAWMKAHSDRFHSCALITSPANTGTSKNCNRGVKAAEGEFIKLLAADDLLSETCIECMLCDTQTFGGDLCFCYEYVFYDSDRKYLGTEYESLLETRPNDVSMFSLSMEELYERLLRACFFPAPTAFYRKTLFKKTGGFDERYVIEDYPFWIRASRAGAKIMFCPTHGVYYRKNPRSVSWRSAGALTPSQQRFQVDLQRFLDEDVNLERRARGLEDLKVQKSLGEKSAREHRVQMRVDVAKKQGKSGLTQNLIRLGAPSMAIRQARLSTLQKLWEKEKAHYEKRLSQQKESHRRALDAKEYRYQSRDSRSAIAHENFHYALGMKLARMTYKLTDVEYKAERESLSRRILSKKKEEAYRLDRMRRQVIAQKPISQKIGNAVMKTLREGEPNTPAYRACTEFMCRMTYQDMLPVEGDLRSVEDPLRLYRQVREEERAFAKEQRQPQPPYRIVFAVWLASSFSSLESILTAMREDSRFEPAVLLLPWAQPRTGKTAVSYDAGLRERIEALEIPVVPGWNAEDGKWVTLQSLRPDAAFFQTPYQSQIPPLYSFFGSKGFPKLFYTPYGPWIMDTTVTDYINDGLYPPFFQTLTAAFMDSLSLEITAAAAPQWLGKCYLTGSPKLDYIRSGLPSTAYCWKQPQSGLPKLLWLPRWGVREERSSFVELYPRFAALAEAGNIELVVRPHPLMWDDLSASGAMSQEEIDTAKRILGESPHSALDIGADYREGLLSCDLAVMDYTSILYEYLPTGKPIVYCRKPNTLINYRLAEACYLVDRPENLDEVLDFLLRGEDPMKEKRTEILKQLELFPGEGENGAAIADCVAKLLADG